jgi:hypothetical protein
MLSQPRVPAAQREREQNSRGQREAQKCDQHRRHLGDHGLSDTECAAPDVTTKRSERTAVVRREIVCAWTFQSFP